MIRRKPAPVGPLAIALRRLHDQTGARHVILLAAVLAIALVAVVVLLLR
jgi:hypothetical protein